MPPESIRKVASGPGPREARWQGGWTQVNADDRAPFAIPTALRLPVARRGDRSGFASRQMQEAEIYCPPHRCLSFWSNLTVSWGAPHRIPTLLLCSGARSPMYEKYSKVCVEICDQAYRVLGHEQNKASPNCPKANGRGASAMYPIASAARPSLVQGPESLMRETCGFPSLAHARL